MICGASGALAASVIRVPQEVLKQRVQADIYPNAAVGLSRLLREKGIGGLYTGYVATISRDVPWNALSFMFFSQAKTMFTAMTGSPPTTEQNLGLGALSGMMAAVIMTPVQLIPPSHNSATLLATHTPPTSRARRATLCHPVWRRSQVDVVKTRLMTGGATGGIVGTMSRIVTEEGAITLMKGVVPRVVFLAPLAAMTLSLYEAFGKALVSQRLQVPASEL